MCLGSSTNFSIYIPSLPKEANASCLALSHKSKNPSSLQTALIPLPPPPAVAFIITGYPIFLAIFLAFSNESMIPPEPGIVGTPASFIVAIAEALSPILSIISAEAPINLILCSSHIFENLEFSDKKPYPG